MSSKPLTIQESNSDSNSLSELSQHFTRSTHVEDGNRTDSDNVEITRAFGTSSEIFHGSVSTDETTVQSNALSNNTTKTLSDQASDQSNNQVKEKEERELLQTLLVKYAIRTLGTFQAGGSSLPISSPLRVRKLPAKVKGQSSSTSREYSVPSPPTSKPKAGQESPRAKGQTSSTSRKADTLSVSVSSDDETSSSSSSSSNKSCSSSSSSSSSINSVGTASSVSMLAIHQGDFINPSTICEGG